MTTIARYKFGYSTAEWGMNRSLSLIADAAGDVCRFSDVEALQARVAEIEDELGSSAVYTLNELQAKVCGLAGERDRLAARVAELETACDLARTAANFLSAERDIIAAELAAALAQEPVAYMSSRTGATVTKAQRQRMQNNGEYNKPLVFAAATPPVREPLTDAEIEAIARAHGTGGWQTLADMQTFARAIEAAIKEQA